MQKKRQCDVLLTL